MHKTILQWTPFVGAVLFAACLLAEQPLAAEGEIRQEETKNSHPPTELSAAFRTAADSASKGLVTIYTLRGPRMTEMWRRRIAPQRGHRAMIPSEELRDEQGSGILIDSEGLVLTCNHVVASAEVVFVVLPDGSKYEVVDIRGDPVADVAVLRIEGASDLDEVTMGNSDGLQVGDWVVSLANPYDLKDSVSAGIVSATERWIPGIPHPFVQNDAATNPGSSGGALLNLRGEVVGMITGGFSAAREFQGIGLAIPINTARQVVDELIDPKVSQRGYLGCETQKLTLQIAQLLELPVEGGLYVKDVEEKSPAASGGIRRGDVITHFDGQPIDDTFPPSKLFDDPVPGKSYPTTYFRNGTSVTVDVEMGRRPSREETQSLDYAEHASYVSEYVDDMLGLGLDALTVEMAKQLHFPKRLRGVLITDVASGSPAYKEGVAAGMVVLRVNSHAISSLDDYKDAISHCPKNKALLVLLQSNKGRHLVVLNR